MTCVGVTSRADCAQTIDDDAGGQQPPASWTPVHPDWDRLVAEQPAGDIVQTTAWAQSKRPLGFEGLQILTQSGGETVGGAQVIIKRYGPLGAIGYIARGPFMVSDQPGAIKSVMDDVEEKARACGVRHLIVQPGEGGEALDQTLLRRGYAEGAPDVAPSATLRLDLSRSLDAILGNMSASQRNRVRSSGRRGVEVKFAERSDIAIFAQLLEMTAKRQGFKPVSLGYLHHQWDALKPIDGVQLIIASFEGNPLAAIWLTAFNGTVAYRLTGFSGEQRERQPVIACHWSAIQWAKEKGFRYYDLGGVDRNFARLMVRGEPLPDSFERSPNFFKACFGGEAIVLPTAKHISFDPLSRLAFKAVYSGWAKKMLSRSIMNRLRSG